MALTVPFSGLNFPEDVHSLGAVNTISFNTVVQQKDDGSEQRIGKFKHPMRSWSIAFDERNTAQLDTIRDFYIARNGSHEGFWFKDWFDYDTTTTPKVYSTGNQQYDRRIDSSIVTNTFRVPCAFEENTINIEQSDSVLMSSSFRISEIRYLPTPVTSGTYGLTSTATLPIHDKMVYGTGFKQWSKVTVERLESKWDLKRESLTATRKRYGISFDLLTYAEAQTYITHFLCHAGRLRAFDFTDPITAATIKVRFDSDDMSIIAEHGTHYSWSIELIEVTA